MKKGKTLEKVMYAMVGAVIIAAVTMLCAVQASSRSAEGVLFDNRAYEEAEETYEKNINEILENYGLYHSGLNMTRTVSLEGGREYEMVIYHSKTARMERAERIALQEELSACKVESPDGRFLPVTVTFLESVN